MGRKRLSCSCQSSDGPESFWASSSPVTKARTDLDWRIPAVRTAEAKIAGGGQPVYMYYYRPLRGFDDVTALVFDNASEVGLLSTSARALVGQISPAWTSFAKGGNPDHPAISDWPAYTLDRRSTFVFDDDYHTVDDPRATNDKSGMTSVSRALKKSG
jgi:carboxylesterase type B